MSEFLGDKGAGLHLATLKQALDAAYLRQQVIANNIANINTPGFRGSYVAFEEFFKEAVDEAFASLSRRGEITQASYLDDIRPENLPFGEINLEDIHAEIRKSDSPVDLNQEMAKLAQAQIQYSALIDSIKGGFGVYKYIIENIGK